MANSEFSVVGLAHKFLLAGESVGYTPSTFNGMAERSDLLADFLAVYQGRARIVPIEVSPVTPVAQANTLMVQPHLTTLERIALGAYDWQNPNITNKRFQHDVTTVGEWEYDLYHLDCDISSDDAKSQAEVDGWVVAKAEHLLAYGKQSPEEQRKFPIIALGSVWGVGADRRVLGLWGVDDKRYVYLYYWDGGWLRFCRFLRVRKVKQSVA